MLEIFDVEPSGDRQFTGVSDGGGRRVVDGSQLLAQAIVACSKTFPNHTARSAHAVFLRVVDDERPLQFNVDVIHVGRTFAGAVVSILQGGPSCASVTVLMDVEHPDVAELHEEVERVSEALGRRLKFLVGKPGLDGHSNGAEQIAVRARDAGMDVVDEGIRLTPSQIATSAAQEGVHVIGLSILSGSHLELIPSVLDALREAGAGEVPVVVGGIIPDADVDGPARSGRRRRLHPQGLGPEPDDARHHLAGRRAQRDPPPTMGA